MKSIRNFGVRSMLAAALGVLLPVTSAQAQIEFLLDIIVNGGNDYNWQRVELPGTICGNGSQYKFWTYDSPSSNNLLVLFEGGGACWDYETCSGQAGVLGAANPNGLADDYIDELAARYVSPIVNGADPGLPFRSINPIATEGWDVAYMPYCTGDTHAGNSVATYHDPTGVNPPIVWSHAGYTNLQAAADYLSTTFPNVNKLLVTGYSAGGVGTAVGYYEMRRAIQPNSGRSLNDSGPLFPASGPSDLSWPLHKQIEAAWGLPTLYDEFPASFDTGDFGSISGALATEFPADKHAYTGYSSDYNFSRFSYERFYPNMNQASILSFWRADQANLVNTMKQYSNFSYFIPWHRPINDSHCSSIITFIGSHACKKIRKKKWYEYFWEPWQSWKCTQGFTPFEDFFDDWVDNGTRYRIVEKQNNYNNEDLGMSIVAPLVAAALGG